MSPWSALDGVSARGGSWAASPPALQHITGTFLLVNWQLFPLYEKESKPESKQNRRHRWARCFLNESRRGKEINLSVFDAGGVRVPPNDEMHCVGLGPPQMRTALGTPAAGCPPGDLTAFSHITKLVEGRQPGQHAECCRATSFLMPLSEFFI